MTPSRAGGDLARRREAVLRHLDSRGLPAGSRVLACAADRESFAAVLEARGLRVDAVEPAAAPGAAGEGYALVLALDVLGCVEHDRWVFQELVRKSRPGGDIVASAPNARSLLRMARRACVALGIAREPPPPPGAGRYTPADVVDLLADEGAAPLLGRFGSEFVAAGLREACPPWQRLDGMPPLELAMHLARARTRYRSWMRESAAPAAYRLAREEIRPERLGRSVLVVAAHPDDEVIGAGGTLALLAASGARVTVCFTTRGEATAGYAREVVEDERSRIRIAEAESVARFLGFDPVFLGGTSTGRGTVGAEGVREGMADLLASRKPDAVLLPSPQDAKVEHREAAVWFVEAARRMQWCGTVLAYELWGFLRPDVHVRVTGVFDAKVEALRRYETGMRGADYVGRCFHLGLWAGVEATGRPNLVEPLRRLSPEELVGGAGG